MSNFVFNTSVHIEKARDPGNVPTEFKNIIHSLIFITRDMIDFYCENLWANNTRSGLGNLPTAYNVVAPDDAAK